VSPSVVASCVIVCWRNPEALRRLLQALDDERLEVIVVNPEIDPEVASVASARIHVPLDGDPGFAAAANVGVRHVSSEYMVAMNDDIDVTVDAVLALVAAVASGKADVAVPAVVDSAGWNEATIRALPTPRELLLEWCLLPDQPVRWLDSRLHVEKWRRPQTPEMVEASGSPVFAMRTALLRAVPFPDDYFLYWDEIDWCWRLREQGRKIAYLPNVTVGHGGGRRDVSPLKSRLITQNAVKWFRKTQGSAAARRAFMIMLAYNIRLVAVAVLRVAAGREAARVELRARLAGLRATRASWYEITGDRAIPPTP
jgi:GT2 family glycosyltransferase